MQVKVFRVYTGELDTLENEINEWLRTLPESDEVKFTNLAMIGEPLQSFAMATGWWGKK
jgi:hypothetical protein